MKKSNYIIMCCALVVSAFLLWLWYALSFNHVDAPFDLVITLIWWLIIALACFAIRRVEIKRQERIRTCYVSADKVFNPEAGTMSFQGADAAVNCMQRTISGLSYGFKLQELPKDEAFLAVVRTWSFVEAESGASRAEEGVLWEGEVSLVSRPKDEPIPFLSKSELRQVLQGVLGEA